EHKETFIRKLLSSIGSENYDIRQLYRMCSMVKAIVDSAPELAEEVYERVFEYKEKSEDAVSMGSPIMPMQSNKRQDYDMCFFHLNEAIGYFLEISPDHGIAAGIKAGEREIFRSHIEGKSESKAFAFTSNETKYSVILDYS